VTPNNVTIVKNQIRLRLILVVDSERVLNPNTIPGFPLVGQNLSKRIHNRPVIFADWSHDHYLALQKLDRIVF
jgi:hypothetical protein